MNVKSFCGHTNRGSCPACPSSITRRSGQGPRGSPSAATNFALRVLVNSCFRRSLRAGRAHVFKKNACAGLPVVMEQEHTLRRSLPAHLPAGRTAPEDLGFVRSVPLGGAWALDGLHLSVAVDSGARHAVPVLTAATDTLPAARTPRYRLLGPFVAFFLISNFGDWTWHLAALTAARAAATGALTAAPAERLR